MKFLKIFYLLIIYNNSFAQYSINSGGGSSEGEKGFISFSIGQVFFQNLDDKPCLIEGIQQVIEIELINTNILENSLNLEDLVYSNPSSDYLIIDVKNINLDYHYILTDIKGQILLGPNLYEHGLNYIPIFRFSDGIYFLKIANKKDVLLKTYKLVKH